MKKIAFHIQKGGVGKTTLSGTLAVWLARQGRKVLFVDCDPNQGSSSTWLLKDDSKVEWDIVDVFLGKTKVQDALQEIEENLFLIPCLPLDSSLRESLDPKLQKATYLVEDLCGEFEKLNFDFAVFDLSPAFALWEQKLLLAMDEVITPLTPEFFSLDGIAIFAHELQELNKQNRKNVKHKKIICNMINKSFKRHLNFLEEIKKLDYEIFGIPQDSKIPNAQYQKMSIFDFDPESKSIPEIVRLGEAVCAN